MRLTRFYYSLVSVGLFFLGYQLALYHYSKGCAHNIDPRHLEYKNSFHGIKADKTFLVIIILSSPNSAQRRQVLRDTWLQYSSKDARHYFIVGISDLSAQVTSALQQESEKHQDLLLLTLTDNYGSLTTKLLEAFVTLSRNLEFMYLLKTDEDSYVKVTDIIDELKNSNYKDNLYWGFFDGRAPVQKRGQWAEPNYKLCDRYIPYALGGGYVLSGNLVNILAQIHESLEIFVSEDVSLGTWLSPFKIHRVHDSRFDTEFTSRGCSNNYLITHKQSEEDLKTKHRSIVLHGQLCTEKSMIKKSYEYNWSVLPSKCCIRQK